MFVRVTDAFVGPHGRLVMVHCSVADVPTGTVTAEKRSFTEAMVAEPAVTVHVPSPGDGSLAFIIKLDGLHSVWPLPASAMAAVGRVVSTTSSVDAAQLPLEIVHRAVALVVLMVSELVGDAALPKDPEPLTSVQAPVPLVAVFAASVKTLLQFV